MANMMVGDAYDFVWRYIVEHVQKAMEDRPFSFRLGRYWTDGSEILFKDEDDAEYFADFLEILGFDAHTGYYDPEEDARNGETNDHTGWYYVDID